MKKTNLLNPNAPRKRGHPFCKDCGGQRLSQSFDGSYEPCRCNKPEKPRPHHRGAYERR